MKAVLATVGLVALAALAAVALFGGGARPSLRPATDPVGSVPREPTAPRAFVPPPPVTTAGAAEAAVPRGIPVPDPAPGPAPTTVGAPAIVMSPAAAPQDGDPMNAASPAPAAAPRSAALPGAISESWGPRPAPALDPRPFSEAHWQGLETIPRTPALVEALGLPPAVPGVIVDDVSLPADLQGFRAGDLIVAVDGFATPNLLAFIGAADRVRDERRVSVDIIRAGAPHRLELVALFERLGTANGETPTMIPPGARSPHPYQGPCLSCHRIGTTGSLATDQGDTQPKPPPPIRAGSVAPHRDRGPCTSCHQILP